MSIDLRTLTAIIFNDTSKKAVKSFFKFLSILRVAENTPRVQSDGAVALSGFFGSRRGGLFSEIRCRRGSISLVANARAALGHSDLRNVAIRHRRGITSHAAPRSSCSLSPSPDATTSGRTGGGPELTANFCSAANVANSLEQTFAAAQGQTEFFKVQLGELW